MKKIKLSNGKYATVDDDNYKYLNQWKWDVVYHKGKGWYACRMESDKVIYMHEVVMERKLGRELEKGTWNRR